MLQLIGYLLAGMMALCVGGAIGAGVFFILLRWGK